MSTGLSTARRALHEITLPNSRLSSSPGQLPTLYDQENAVGDFPKRLKKRKLLHTPELPCRNEYAKVQRLGGADSVVVHDTDEDVSENNFIPSSPCARAACRLAVDLAEDDDSSVDLEEDSASRLHPISQISTFQPRGLAAETLGLAYGARRRGNSGRQTIPVYGKRITRIFVIF